MGTSNSRNPLHFDIIEGRGKYLTVRLTHSKLHYGLPKTPLRYTTNYLKHSKTLCLRHFSPAVNASGLPGIQVHGQGEDASARQRGVVGKEREENEEWPR